MMIVMKPTATEEDIQAVIGRIEGCGARAHLSRGEEVTVIGAVGDREHVQRLGLEGHTGVSQVVPILKPYKLSSSQFSSGRRSVIEVGGRQVGGEHFSLIAGPCTVESRDQLMTTARAVSAAGASMLRGGAYKPRSSPYSFQGLGQEGLRLLAEAKAETGLPIVTELMDARDVEAIAEVADVIQIGARNMQNYPLLAELGRTGLPVLLKELSHLPVIVDPSHAPGRRDLVLPLSLAAAAAGADGIIVEVHPNPEEAICDGPQQLYADQFADYVDQVERVAAVVGKVLSNVAA